ncbi:MAG: AtpZ/AtpI family protein [bacterium]|jgi:hypothetical protein
MGGYDSGGWRGVGLAMSIPFMLGAGPILGWFIGVWLDGVAGTGFLRFAFLVLGFVAGVRSVARVLREDLRPEPVSVPEMRQGADEFTAIGRAPTPHAASESDRFVDEDGHTIGTMSYNARIRRPARPFAPSLQSEPETTCEKPPDPPALPEAPVESDSASAAPGIGGEAAGYGDALFSLPAILGSGLAVTAAAAAVAGFVIDREIGLGMIAAGLWNLCNFAVLWMAFKVLFSGKKWMLSFTIPIVFIKIPLLYFLVVQLFRLRLFDSRGMVLGLLVLPVVFLYLALIGSKAGSGRMNAVYGSRK